MKLRYSIIILNASLKNKTSFYDSFETIFITIILYYLIIKKKLLRTFASIISSPQSTVIQKHAPARKVGTIAAHDTIFRPRHTFPSPPSPLKVHTYIPVCTPERIFPRPVHTLYSFLWGGKKLLALLARPSFSFLSARRFALVYFIFRLSKKKKKKELR